MKSKIVKGDFAKLNAFLKGLKSAKKYAVDVGVLGKKAKQRGDDSHKTNAEIGYIHEMGYPSLGIPQRSFLRMPLFQKSEKIIKETVRDATIRKQLASGNTVAVLGILGVACERVIDDAFNSRGFGTWKPNTPATLARKEKHTHSTMPLIDWGFLRKSISSAVVTL